MRRLNTRWLKILAIVVMTIDHTGQMLFPDLTILYVITRPFFPIFCFMTAFSATKTRNIKKYTLRMFIFAIATQPIYSWAMYLLGEPIYELNIFFTFTLALVIIMLLRTKGDERILAYLGALFLFLIPWLLPLVFDYAVAGVCLPLFYYFGLMLIKPKTTIAEKTTQSPKTTIAEKTTQSPSANSTIALKTQSFSQTQPTPKTVPSHSPLSQPASHSQPPTASPPQPAPHSQPNYFLFVLVCAVSILLFNLVFSLFFGWGMEWWSMFGAVVLLFFTEKKPKFGRFEKWFFYVYYPLHLLILSIINVVVL